MLKDRVLSPFPVILQLVCQTLIEKNTVKSDLFEKLRLTVNLNIAINAVEAQ